MTNESLDSTGEIIVPTTMDEVDVLLGRLARTSELARQMIRQRDVAVAEIQELAAVSIAPLESEQAQLREAVATYLRRRRKSILHRNGRTIQLASGVIKWRVVPRSLDAPKDDKDLINFLLNLHGGKRYLRATYSLDKKALALAGPKLMRRLRSFGVWVGRHENLTIQASGEPKPVVVRHNRFPNRRYQ